MRILGAVFFLSLLAGKLNRFKQMLTRATKGTYRQYKEVDYLFLHVYCVLSLLAGKLHNFEKRLQKLGLLERKQNQTDCWTDIIRRNKLNKIWKF